MNKLKEKREIPIQEEEPVKKVPAKGNRLFRSIGSLFSGSFLAKENAVKQLPFLLFLTLLAILYISNGYYAEQKIRELNQITAELKELRSEYIITKSDLMFISKQSEVAKAAAPLGLKESVVPPKKIAIKKDPLLPDKE